MLKLIIKLKQFKGGKMELKIKNIGKIKEGNVKLDGITVISGKGDAGKTTVLKVLSTVLDVLNFSDDSVNFSYEQNGTENNEEIIQKDVQARFENNFGKMINNVFSNGKGMAEIIVEDEIGKSKTLKISIKENFVKIEENDVKIKIENIFIDNPASFETTNIDNLLMKNAGHKNIFLFNDCERVDEKENNARIKTSSEKEMIKNQLASKTEETETNIGYFSQQEIKTTTVLQSRDELFKIYGNGIKSEIDYKKFKRLNEVVKGTFELLNPVEYELGEYGYKITDKKEAESDTKTVIPLKNLSHSLKKLAFLKMIMEKQLLKENDILIIDNAEYGLHPEMQLIFGETVVLMQKEFGIKVVLTTQSPFLLEAIEVFSEKYDIEDKIHYYLVEDGNIRNVDGETRQIYKEMVQPIQELENIKYE